MKQTRLVLLLLLLLSHGLLAFRLSFMPMPLLVDVFLRMAHPFVIASLCIIDSRVRDQRLPLSTHWFLLLVPVGPLVYLFWSRGVWALVLIPALVVALIIATLVGYALGVVFVA